MPEISDKQLEFLEQFQGVNTSSCVKVFGKNTDRINFKSHGLNLLLYHQIKSGEVTSIDAVLIGPGLYRIVVNCLLGGSVVYNHIRCKDVQIRRFEV